MVCLRGLLSAVCVALASALWAAPEVRWSQTLDGSPHGNDYGYLCRVDASGNIYVACQSENGSGADAMVARYDPSGGLVWTRRFNSGANSGEWAWDMEIDPFGNVVLCSLSTGGPNDEEFSVVKYAPNGDVLWSRVRDFGGGDDLSYALDVDGAGNVYVAGIVTGAGTYDAGIVKYSADGTEQWVRTYNGAQNGFDEFYALDVTPAGEVYAVGDTVDSGGASDHLVIKYDTNGNVLWTRILGQAGIDEFPYSAAIGVNGVLYFTGVKTGAGGFAYDVHTLAYDPSGNLLWERVFDGEGRGYDYGFFVTASPLGGCAVGASLTNRSGDDDTGVLKYSANGTFEWGTVVRDEYWLGSDYVGDVRFDGQGNLYASGSIWSGWGDGDNWFVQKYSTAGALLWQHRYDGPNSGVEGAGQIAFDPSGAVVVSGSGTGANGADVLTFKYSEDLLVQPTSFQATRGVLQSGGLADLLNSDDSSVVISQRPQSSPALANAELTAFGNAGIFTASTIALTVELKSNGVPSSRVVQRLSMFNFQTNQWTTLDERAPTTSDSTVAVTVSAQASSYLSPSGEIRARIGWFDRGTISPNWTGSVDLVRWEIGP